MSTPCALLFAAATLITTPLQDLSPTSSIDQWEISTAVLPGAQADRLCPAAGRPPGDPQVFESWVVRAGDQRLMSCALSDLGQPVCDAGSGTARLLKFPPWPQCTHPAYTGPVYVPTSNDNVMVRLRDGRIVQIVQTIKLNCPPSSADGQDNDGDGFVDESGESACFEDANTPTEDREQIAYVVRVTDDCGQTWDESVLDADQIRDLSGYLLAPAKRNFDRVEAYADPWSDHILLTSSTSLNQCCCSVEEAFLHASTAGGVTSFQWQRLFEVPNTAWPNTAITSMPRPGGVSRVYWFDCTGGRPKIYFSDDPWNQTTSPPPQAIEIDTLLVAGEGGGVGDYGCELIVTGTDTPIWNPVFGLSAARVSTDGISDTVRAAYPQVVTAGGRRYQTLRLADVTVSPDGAGGFTGLAATSLTIDAATGRQPADRGSVLWATIAQADMTTPQDPSAATQLLHWTEILDSGNAKEVARSWSPAGGWSAASELGGWVCSGNCSTGDYQYGAFVDTVDDCSHRFLVPWGVQQPSGSIETHGALVLSSTDGAPPVLAAAPADAVVECDAVPMQPALGATDDCDPEPALAQDEKRTDGACEDDYTLTRIWTAADNVGLESMVSQTLTVHDTAAPRLEGVPADESVECDAVPQVADLAATDACDPAPAVTVREDRVDGSCPDDYTLHRVWSATDRCGNTNDAAQIVTVADTIAPEIVPGTDDLHCVWPPNHRYVCFGRDRFAPAVTDGCAESVTWRFAACVSDQPQDANGDGRTDPDCVIGAGGESLCVRAERDGAVKAGRRYAVMIEATDECGNTSSPVTIGAIHVPHDKKSAGGCVDAR